MQDNSNIQLFDTHCHLDFEQFDGDIASHLEQARCSHVHRLLIPSIGPENWNTLSSISEKHPNVFHALGFHPYFLKSYHPERIAELEKRVDSRTAQCVAIGECGLDAAIDVDSAIQEKFLISQFKIAQNAQLPIILHSRKMQNRLLQLIKAHRIEIGGVIHGFSGSYQQAMAFVDRGFKIGVGGTITYPRANKTRSAVTRLPLQAIVLETDAPDMPINGYQGSSNHPMRLPMVLDALSQLRNESIETIAISIWENSNQIFKIYV
ncbi:TatD family hydrolase [Vibrio marisflavi]|uniref:Metal-dependent hydrolase YjjV n=1 Tax=Vibrio marisflavi CECT 7928 TaxID=634439 RepID=A0ABM9A7H6_9VIBR|nr:TatD family hydrolase [Vibrio marisflavi]CAH0541242.1 putative metal-dependent hydrolase YjjV [Vibrio marisflavi CECT 7928]